MTTALSTKDKTRNFLLQIAKSVSDLAGREVTPERISTLILAEASDTKLYDIMETTDGRKSVANFFRLSTQLQLEPGKALGLLYMTPRRIKGTWQVLPIVGYKGLAELARRSGQIARINAQPFYSDDLTHGLLDISIEPPLIKHRWSPTPMDKTDKQLVGAYAVAELKDGSLIQVVLSREDIEDARRRSPTGDKSFSPWASDYSAMARKTAIRRLLMGGLVPLSTETRIAMDYAVDRPEVIDTTAREVSTKVVPAAIEMDPLSLAVEPDAPEQKEAPRAEAPRTDSAKPVQADQPPPQDDDQQDW